MSKPIKSMIMKDYAERFADLPGLVIVDVRGVDANTNNALRHKLAERQIRVTVVKNSLARNALKGTTLEPIGPLLDGGCAFVYNEESVVTVARELIDQVKQIEALEFRGAVMEGTVFGPDEIEALSKYPTREEAIGQTVQLLLSPGRNLAASIASPASKIASCIKTIQEKLEDGETIEKVA